MKILVMDHSSSEILEMSVELCGLTKFIRAPISVEELYITLIQTVDKQQSRERRESDFLREQILHTEKKEEALKQQIIALAQANVRMLEEFQNKKASK